RVCIRMIMFKAARLLQAAPIFAFFTGCASVPPAINTAQADATTSRPKTLATAPSAVQLRASPASSIKAGQSVPGSGPFTTPEGQLQPDIQAYAREVAATRNVPQEHVE